MVDNKYGLEPEEYADLETNYPQLDKNTSSGQSPKNPFIGGGGGGSSLFETIGTIPAVDAEVDYDSDSNGAEIAVWAEIDRPCSLGELKITASYTTNSGEVTDTVTIPRLPHYFGIEAQEDYLIVLTPTTDFRQYPYVDESKTSGIISVVIPDVEETGKFSLGVYVVGQPIGKVHLTLTACDMITISKEFKDAMYLAQEV